MSGVKLTIRDINRSVRRILRFIVGSLVATVAVARSHFQSAAKSRLLSVAFVAALGIVLSAIAFVGVTSWESQLRAANFQSIARGRNQTIANNLAATDDLVRGIAEYIKNIHHVISADEFRAMTSSLRSRHPEVLSTGWAVRVAGDERDAFERRIKAAGDPNFEIFETGPDGKRRRAADRNGYVPIIYRDPDDESMMGFDVSSTPERAEALRRALASGRLVASVPLKLIAGDRAAKGLMIFAPASGPRPTGAA